MWSQYFEISPRRSLCGHDIFKYLPAAICVEAHGGTSAGVCAEKSQREMVFESASASSRLCINSKLSSVRFSFVSAAVWNICHVSGSFSLYELSRSDGFRRIA